MELVHIDGKPYALIPMHDYRRLMSGAVGGPQDQGDLPDHILDQLAGGQVHPVKIIRKYRGLTQMDLAGASGLSRPYLTEIETRKKNGSIAAMQVLAVALNVPVGVLLG